jgi:hypothetical protein
VTSPPVETVAAAVASDAQATCVVRSCVVVSLHVPVAVSWRVKPATSLLAPCGTKVEESNPSKPFFADDLALGARCATGGRGSRPARRLRRAVELVAIVVADDDQVAPVRILGDPIAVVPVAVSWVAVGGERRGRRRDRERAAAAGRP